MNTTSGISCLCYIWGSPLSNRPEDLHRQEVVVTTISGSVLIKYVTPTHQENRRHVFYSRPLDEPQIMYEDLICLLIMEEDLIIVVLCVRSAAVSNYKKSLDVSCVSSSSHSKPVLNGQLLRWEWFCTICITSSCLTGPEWENIHRFKEHKQWLLMFTAVTYQPPLLSTNHTHSHLLVTTKQQWWFGVESHPSELLVFTRVCLCVCVLCVI